MATTKSYKMVFGLGAKIDSSFNNSFARANRQMNAINSSGSKLKNTFAGLAAGGFLLNTAKQALTLASSLTEVQNVINVVFGEKNSERINKWAYDAQYQFGLSQLAAKRYVGTLGAMLDSAGVTGTTMEFMSTKLTGLAADFSSFYNISQQFAFEKIQAGLAGEIEPLMLAA